LHITSGMDHSGSDLVGSLVVACYGASPRHQCYIRGSTGHVNITVRGLKVLIDYIKVNYDLFTCDIIYYIYNVSTSFSALSFDKNPVAYYCMWFIKLSITC
jgi:hypothetical protein